MPFSKQQFFLVIAGALLGGTLFFVFGTRTALSPTEPLDGNTASTTATSSTVSESVATDERIPVTPLATKTPATPVSSPIQTTTTAAVGRLAPELVRPTGYSNIDNLGMLSTEQFTLKRWVGKKVILLEFWTTSSLASIHTLPYLNYWYSAYKDDGLLVVGVHTPQFAFERSKSVLDQVIFDRDVHFPVILDNEYSTWNAYKSSVWPHRYLIDISGRIVYEHKGDGSYEATQAKITELLAARARKLGESFTPVSFQTPKDAFETDLARMSVTEVFFGAARNKSLANGVSLKEGVQNFEAPTSVALNTIALSGSWNFSREYAQNMTENTSASYRYNAKNLLAMLSSEKITKVTVLSDGKPLDATNAGADIRFEKGVSVFYVKDARIYEVIKNSAGYGEHTITLTPDSGGLRVYSLMFE